MSTATAVTMLDVRAGSGAITLPLTTEIPYRVLTIKDTYGAAALSSITINTQGNDVFENGASSITLTNTYDTTTLYAGMPGYWYTIGGSRLGGASFNILSTGLISNPLRLGTLSTQTSIQFPGLRQGYTGTVITEQTTGAGTQELLFYKASSISDQIRLQTTGSIVFEAGAAVRSFPSTTQLATPTLYIAGSTSNIGIGTATPATTLDVAGTGRFQTLSTLNFNLSSINGQTISQLATVPLESTVIGLGSAGYVSSASLQSTFNAITYAITQNTVDTIFYFNPVIHAPTYMQMSPTQTTFPQSTLTTSIPRNTSNNAIAQFQTDFTVPQVIPNGAWDLNLFAYTAHARSYIYTSLFARAGVTETLIASSSNATTNIGTSPVQQYTNTIFVPQTIFTSTNGVSLVIKIFANNAANQDDTLYTFYQGANYSHAHTTFGTVVPDTLFTSTVSGLGSAGYVSSLTNVALFSSLQMNVSSIVARTVSSATGYISSLRTDSLSVGGSDGYVSIQDLTAGTVSTGQLVAGQSFISSLQINSLSFGPTGYVIVGNFIASSLSTMKLNTQNLYANNAYIGNLSSQSAILFPGIDGNFTGTAVAEQTTGAGSQELLLYKSFTAADRIRLQTTGNIVFEAGASSRNWPSTQTLATPTMYIAGSTSNVGIGTASPAATLDVVGQGRFQNISSFALNVSSINGGPPGGTPFTGSTNNLLIPYASNNTVSTFTIMTNTPSSVISFGTNTGKTQSQVYIGDLFNQLNLSTISSPVVLIDSVFPTQATSISTFRSSGIFTVPSNVSFINVHLWGSGGSNSGSVAGGGGAYLTGFLPVRPGQRLHVTINQGGGRGQGGYVNINGGGFTGIYDTVSTVNNVLVVAAGGGGGGGYSDRGGGGGGVFEGKTVAYSGGTQTTPGSYGTAYKLQGGDGPDNSFGAGPGGGGGWFGGSGGSGDSVGIVSGSGGSSYFSNLINWSGEDGGFGHLGGLAGGRSSPYYTSNYGNSNTIGAAVILWAPTLRQTNLLEIRDVTQGRLFGVTRNLNMGIGVSSIGNNYTVEVNGNVFISSLVTLNTTTSNITIPLSNFNPLTLTSTQAIFTMNTLSSGSQLAFGTTQAYGLFGKYSQVYVGDVKQLQGNFTNSDPVLRIDQDFPLTPSSNVSIISFSTTVTTYTVPAGMTMAKAYLWGQGGKGWGGTTDNGGGAAFVSGTFSVIPGEQLAIAVNYGGGGGFGANGGGLTGIFRSTIAQSNSIAIAAGGGGGGSYVTTVGGYGGVVAGSSGSYRGPNVGVGATQTAAGAGAGEGAGSGGALQGGGGGAGGGAGYFGGGGGGNNSVDQVGGGGGSSFVGGLFPGSIVAENGNLGTPPGIGPLPGMGLGGGKFAPFYFGSNGDRSGPGWGVIVFARAFRQTNLLELRGPTNRNLVAIDSQMNMGINVSSVNSSISLDVGGIGRFLTLSTFTLNISSINGAAPGGTPFTGSTISLSTASIFTSTLLTNNMTVNSTITANIANFSPKSIHGLQMWMDAADRTTFNYSSGSTIRYWLDKSGNGYDASNYTNAFTSTTCVVLSGSGLYTHLNASGMAGNVFKEYGFIVFTSADSNDINLLSGNYYQNRNVNVQNGSFIRIHNSGGEYIANIAGPRWQLHTPQLVSWSSGGYIGFNASTIVNSGSNFSSYMGAWGQRNTQFGNFSGTLREIVIYQGVTLSSNDIYAVEGYLASKWGITSNMDSTHPYKNFNITTSSFTTIDAFTTLTNNNNLRITTSKYLDRSSNIYPVTAPKIQLLGHLDSRVSVQEMQTLNTGVVLTLTSGLFGTFFRLPAAPGGYYFSFPLVYLPDDIGGYWDLYNTTNGAITITVSNGRGLGNFVMNPLDICRITWSGTTHLLTYSSKWPSYLGQDIGNSRLGINTGPAYTLDVAGNARFTSNVGIGTTPLSGTNYLDVIGTSRFQIISTLALNVSSINGALPGAGGGGTTFVGSTMFLSAAQVLISTQTNYNLSSVLGYVSSLQVDELQIGSGYGTLSFGETQMSSISSMAVVAGLGQFMTMSTLAINASSITGVIIGATFPGTLGTVSSLTALTYYGLTGSYANTAIAEVSTGVGTQELLLYKVSSISDQIRLQTTGNVIFEAGVGARTWPNAPRIATPTFYIAGSNSNVGVGTSNPLTTFDVAGTGRFQTLSSLNITAGSINYSIAYV